MFKMHRQWRLDKSPILVLQVTTVCFVSRRLAEYKRKRIKYCGLDRVLMHCALCIIRLPGLGRLQAARALIIQRHSIVAG